VSSETDNNDPAAASEGADQDTNDSPNTAEAPISEAPAGDATAERDKLKQQLLRTAADFDNFRKRSRREIEDAALRGKELTIREFLPIFDNLDRALSAAGSTEDGRAIVEGVRMVLKQFEDTCERIGIRRIPTVGERFDPTIHEAIQQQETAEHPAGTIVAEVAAGYMFGPRLLRAAMVVVAKPPSKAVEAEPEASGS